jgi:superfamily II DNA or RNA helicase
LDYLLETLPTTGKAVVVQPTGSGKSGVMFGYIDSIYEEAKRILIVQPSVSIEVAQKSSSLWDKKWEDKVRYITYSKMSQLQKMDDAKIEKQGFTDVDLVILDEVHHIAAPVWSRGFAKLKDKNPNCKFIGLTATPVRYLDGGLNVAEEYFDGHLIETVTLADAIKEGIFRKPRYVTAYFGKDRILADMESRIHNFISSEEYKETLWAIYSRVKSSWDRQSSLKEKIKKYTDMYYSHETNPKFVVFMSSIDELHTYKNEIESWFKTVRKKVVVHDVYSGNGKDDDKVFKSFQRTRKDTVDLLFAVDKLNEGVHFKKLTGLVMLRSTSSPTVYYQQLGRPFFSGMKEEPLIFDFVNNQDSLGVVRSTLIVDDKPLYEKVDGYATCQEYTTMTLWNETLDLSILTTKLNVELYTETSHWLLSSDFAWDKSFKVLSEFIRKHKRLPSVEDGYEMYSWFRTQVGAYQSNKLSRGRKEDFESLGVVS